MIRVKMVERRRTAELRIRIVQVEKEQFGRGASNRLILSGQGSGYQRPLRFSARAVRERLQTERPVRDAASEFHPVNFQQDNLGIFHEAVFMDDAGLVKDLASFAWPWNKVLRELGFVEVARAEAQRRAAAG